MIRGTRSWISSGAGRIARRSDRGNEEGDGGACCAKKKCWGTLTGVWVPHDTRDQIVDFVRRWSDRTEIGVGRFVKWLGVRGGKFYEGRERYGKANEHRS